MTQQEIFDTVANHLFTQEVRAMDGPVCCYRTKEGLKCAAGCLIPDEIYTPSMERRTFTSLTHRPFGLPDYLLQNFGLIQSLQDIHDDSDYVLNPQSNELDLHKVDAALSFVAKTHKLKYTRKFTDEN